MKIMKLISSLGKGEELVLFSACVVKLHSLGRPLNRVPVRRIVRWGGRDYFTVAMSDENGFVKFDSLTVRQSFLSSIASSPVEQQLIVNYEKRDWMLWIAKKYDDYSVNGECNGKPLTFDCDITLPNKQMKEYRHQVRSRFKWVDYSVSTRGRLTAA